MLHVTVGEVYNQKLAQSVPYRFHFKSKALPILLVTDSCLECRDLFYKMLLQLSNGKKK